MSNLVTTSPSIVEGTKGVVSSGIEAPKVKEVTEICTLIPGLFGLGIQFLLCIISVVMLLLKYMFEVPRRPKKVFMMDFIQLMCGSSTVHILNIISSILINKYRLSEVNSAVVQDECNMYFMTTLFDATVGVYIEYKIIRYLAIRRAAYNYLKRTRKSKFTPTLQELADATRLATANMNMDIQPFEPDIEDNASNIDDEDELLVCDNSQFLYNFNESWFVNHINKLFDTYNHWSNKKSSKEFLHNLYTWFVIVSGLKFASILIFTIFSYQINFIASYLLSAFNRTYRLKLLFVMIISPLFLNVFQYYVTDSIIKIKVPICK